MNSTITFKKISVILLTGVFLFIFIGRNSLITQAANSDTTNLKIMKNPPEITIYEEDISSSSYKLEPVMLDGEVNPVYTSYNASLSGNNFTIIGNNGLTNTMWRVPNSYTIEFTIDCKDFVFHSSPFFRISVDEGNGYELTSYEGFTDKPYTWSYFKVSFPEKKKRNIRIELTLAFWGIYLQDGDSITKLERESKPKALFIGTSITQGIYKYSNQANCLVGYPAVISNLLDFECMNNGAGGTGYLTAGAFTTYYDRLVYAVENLNPDIIFIEGGPNDVDRYDNDAIVTEAERCHAYLREHAPDTRLIIIGLYHHTGYEYLPQKHKDLNFKLREEALKYGIPYIDLLTGDTIAGDGTILTEGYVDNTSGNCYITGNGNVSNTTGTGNADIYIDSDNYHPTVAGYRFLGTQLSTEIEKILDYEKN